MIIPHTSGETFQWRMRIWKLLLSVALCGMLIVFSGLFLFFYFQNQSFFQSQKKAIVEINSSKAFLKELFSDVFIESSEFQKSVSDLLVSLDSREWDYNLAPIKMNDSFFELEVLELQKLKQFLSQASEKNKELSVVLNRYQKILSKIPSIWPLQNGSGILTHGFGPAFHPFVREWYLHKGVDIAHRAGFPIVNTAEGRVIEVANRPLGWGLYVKIAHAYGFSTFYAHMSAVNVSVGDTVKQGQIIGYLGNTGLSTGPHLHYEVRLGNDNIDPLFFFD